MKKIIKSLAVIVAVAAVAGGATFSYFSDTETSENNTFSAGTLDLQVDGENPLTSAKFSVDNMRPGNQPKGTYNLENVGSINGYIDLENIVVTSYENSCNEPEDEAGDTTCNNPGEGEGELQNVVNLRLFVDNNCDGWISTGDTTFYNDVVANLPGNFDLDEQLNAGDNLCITALFDWWNTADDNLAQGDSMELDLDFELNQNND